MSAGAKAIVLPATKKHTATIICLHGLGDSGSGWSWLGENWRRREKFADTKFIFPNAPIIPITSNWGARMPGWYDITSFNALTRSEDEPGILRSRTYIHSLIAQQISEGIPPERIILGGFSQGGAMSIFSGLTLPSDQIIGGVFGLSCYLLIPEKFDELRSNKTDPSAAPPVFQGHGTADTVVKFEYGKKTADALKERGFKLDWHQYEDMEHTADVEEIDALEAWVTKRLAEGAKAVSAKEGNSNAAGAAKGDAAL